MHPSAILRMRDEDERHAAFAALVADFEVASAFVKTPIAAK
jgi:hypothetical protein